MYIYRNKLPLNHKIQRFIWNLVWQILVRPLPRNTGRVWVLFLLRLFGAKVHRTANVYSSVKVYAPWNLEMQEHSCLAPEVDCYNVAKILLGPHSSVSQKTFLCTASHDITKKSFRLVSKPIILEKNTWIGASSFIGMGVTVGQGAVVGATSSVYKDVERWTVVGGNPAKFIRKRIIHD
jgi:putative colanic acid biosynthesis acetyltransferase WcaF